MSNDFLTEKEEKTLAVELRRKIYQTVRTYPGSNFREIERKSKLATGSVQHHLTYLIKQGLLKSEKDGNKVRYFPKDFSSTNEQLMSLLRQRSVRNIILFILTHENCSHEEIVKEVNLSPSTVTWHMKKLIDGDIIKDTRHGRKTLYIIKSNKEELKNIIITYKESFLDAVVDNVVETWESF